MKANDPRSPVIPQASPRGSAPPIPTKQSNLLYVGPRQLIAAILGVLLYGALSHANLILIIPGGTPDVFLPALLIPLLLGVIYGPWVGLVVGGFGFLLGDYAANFFLHDLSGNSGYLYYALTLVNRDVIGWDGIPGYLASALIGLVAGLTRMYTRRYNTFNALAIVGIMCAVAIIIATAIVAYSAVWIYNTPYYTLAEATAAFFDTTMPNMLFALLVLPFLLRVYDLVASRSKNV